MQYGLPAAVKIDPKTVRFRAILPVARQFVVTQTTFPANERNHLRVLHVRNLHKAESIARCNSPYVEPPNTVSGEPRAAGILLSAMLLMAITGCAPDKRALTDDERIVGAVLTLLAQDRRSVCVDDSTQGQALAVFHEMQAAPRPARLELNWHRPLPLRPDIRVTTRALRDAEFEDQPLTIQEPGARTDLLPGLDQLRFDGAAARLGEQIGRAENAVDIRQAWVPAGVAARWWPINRMRRDCWPLFEISDPVRDRDMAFVTVRAEHWGTLYALQKTDRNWRIAAEWSRWLY